MNQRFLTVYSGVLTLALAVIVLTGSRSPKKAEFDEITVHRINVVEPDGTMRLVISDKARCPGIYVRGKELLRSDRCAGGFLFMDDEGSEVGGQLWGGGVEKGQGYSYGHLSFDRKDGDQMFVVNSGSGGDGMATRVEINDSWADPHGEEDVLRDEALPAPAQKAALDKWKESHPLTNRILLMRDRDESAGIYLKDAQGRSRISLRVDPQGKPSLEFLNAAGKVIARLPAGQ